MQNKINSIADKQQQLKILKQKCELQNKKIKLFRKDNQEIKHNLARQMQINTSLLLNSKELSNNNAKLESTIQQLKKRVLLQLNNDSKGVTQIALPSVITIQNNTITEQTQQIDLQNQALTDDDIIPLAQFTQLKNIMLGQNQIADNAVEKICKNLVNLQRLQLNNNNFTCQGLSFINNLQKLKVLDFRGNKLGNDVVKLISQLPSIQQLSLSNNQISDTGVSYLQNVLTITYLDLTTNLITNQGVKSLLKLNKLTHLYLMSNRITEQCVQEVMNLLEKLEVFDIRFNINDPVVKEKIRASKPDKLQLFC